ncbi:MAG: hypothetical protein OEL89_03040, partial [Candidatus Peregrinibacteria bacterium]|nr:hypothetical protein [Candidatus Peregrinibacteria bacterium]
MKNLFKNIPEELIQQYALVRKDETFVIKVGGEIFEKKEKLDHLIQAIQFLVKNHVKVILVHGAGPQVSSILNEVDRSGKRITPPKKIPEIDEVCLSLSETIGKTFPKSEIISPIHIQSPKKAANNSTANISSLAPAIQKLIDTNRFLIAGHIGIDPETGENTNINADEVAAEIAKKIKADKLFYLTATNGVLNEKNQTIPELHPDEIDIEDPNFKGGMKPKIARMKDVASTGIHVHACSWKRPSDIVYESFVPEGTPETVTEISLEQVKDKWKTLEKSSPFIKQLLVLIELNPNLLPRKEKDIVDNLENWHLLIKDRVIKGSFEIKKHDNIWEFGGLNVPEYLQKNNIGTK